MKQVRSLTLMGTLLFLALIGLALSATLLIACQPATSTASPARTSSSAGASTATSPAAVLPDGLAGANNRREIRIHVTLSDADREMLATIIPRLEGDFPDLHIVVEPLSDREGALLKTRAAIGELPDILEGPEILLKALHQSGDILSLEDRIVTGNLLAPFKPDALQLVKTTGGHICGVRAARPTPMVFFYNRGLFRRLSIHPPDNAQAWRKAVTILADGGFIPLAIGAQENWRLVQLLDQATLCDDPNGLLDWSTGTPVLNVHAATAGIRRLVPLVHLGLLDADARTTDSAKAMSLLRNGQAGMLFDEISSLRNAGDQADLIDILPGNPFSDPGKEFTSSRRFSGGASTGGFAVSRFTGEHDPVVRFLFAYLAWKSAYETTTYGMPPLMTEAFAAEAEAQAPLRRGPVAESGVFPRMAERLASPGARMTRNMWEAPAPIRRETDMLLGAILAGGSDWESILSAWESDPTGGAHD